MKESVIPLDNKSKDIIPLSLYWILWWFVTTAETEMETFGNRNSSNKNEADGRHIFMIAQDIMHSTSHGTQKMPKHVRVGHVS